jgi:hypothetical protein
MRHIGDLVLIFQRKCSILGWKQEHFEMLMVLVQVLLVLLCSS